jgi:hypothetical protein
MTQQDSYQRALARAHAVGLKVMGTGAWANGSSFYVVTSASEAGRFHLVTVYAGRLACDCTAGSHSRMCQHRALVHEQIERERRETHQVEAAMTAALAPVHAKLDTMLASFDNPVPAQRPAFSIWASDR